MAKEKAPDPEASNPAEKAKPKRSLKKILIMGVLGLLLVGGGLVAYVMFTDDPPVGKEAHASQAASKNVVNMPLEPFLVNLADKESRRYLKLKVELEVNNEETAKELEKSMPRIRDTLILLLSNKTYLDLASYQGKQQLKQEIKQKVTSLPGGNKISDVFFTEFVAQ
jgi:flagellar protein FliL